MVTREKPLTHVGWPLAYFVRRWVRRFSKASQVKRQVKHFGILFQAWMKKSDETDLRSPLELCCIHGCSDEVFRASCNKSENLMALDSSGNTLLHLATANANYSAISILLELNLPVDSRNASEETPLILASQSGAEKAVLLLLEAGASTEITTSYGWTAVHCAIFTGRTEIVKRLLSYGGDLRRNTSSGTLFPSKTTILNQFLNFYQFRPTDNLDDYNLSVLHIAAISGLTRSMTYLVREHQDLDVNSRSAKGKTPLYLAAALGRWEMVQMLISKGGDMTIADETDDCTPLEVASSKGFVYVVSAFLNAKPKLDALGKHFESA